MSYIIYHISLTDTEIRLASIIVCFLCSIYQLFFLLTMLWLILIY